MADGSVNVTSDDAAGPLTAGLTFLAVLLAAAFGLLRLLWRKRRSRVRRRHEDKTPHQQQQQQHQLFGKKHSTVLQPSPCEIPTVQWPTTSAYNQFFRR
jgi:membrane protein implicated in regulation of membrane protease activity